MSSPILFGIDLGTTNTLIAHFLPMGVEGEIQLIEGVDGDVLIPSVVHFYPGSREYCVGSNALAYELDHPDRTFRWMKRHIGSQQAWTVELSEGEHIEVDARTVSARILKAVLKRAQQWLRLPEIPNEAVISVPAYFSEQEKVATKEAAEIAGLTHSRLIEEPTAAVFDFVYALKRTGQLGRRFPNGKGYILVFDLGGGTFDVSVAYLDLMLAQEPQVRIVANHGIRNLGGFNFDMELLKYGLDQAKVRFPSKMLVGELAEAIRELEYDGRISNRQYASLISDALITAETCKQRLSNVPRPEITQPFNIVLGYGEQVSLEISRGEFETLLEPFILQIKSVLQETLTILIENTDGEISNWEQLDEVILVGGSTRIPAIRDLLKDTFGYEPTEDVRKDQVVVKGAAIQAAIDSGFQVLQVARCTAYDYGIGGPDGMSRVIIPRGSLYPSENKTKYPVPFSLTTRQPITIVENTWSVQGTLNPKIIKEVSYHHPLLLTGDELEVTCSIDESGLLRVFVEDPRNGEAVESSIKDISMTDEEKEQARADVQHEISPDTEWDPDEMDDNE